MNKNYKVRNVDKKIRKTTKYFHRVIKNVFTKRCEWKTSNLLIFYIIRKHCVLLRLTDICIIEIKIFTEYKVNHKIR